MTKPTLNLMTTLPHACSATELRLHSAVATRLPLAAIAASLLLAFGSATSGEMIRSNGGPTKVPSPDVEWIASPNYNSRSGTKVDSIVIHTTEVSYAGTIDIFTRTSSQVSAHFVIAPDGHILQMVDTANRAWHATYYNSRSVGIEMVGYAAQASTWNENNLAALTDLLAWLVTAYDVSLVHPPGDAYDFPGDQYNSPGLVAHAQVQPWNRSDPGRHFPWNQVLADTQAKIDAVPEPTSALLSLLAVASIGLLRRGSLRTT